MIFLDTSGVIALADKEDVFHGEAVRMFDTVQEVGESILVHSYFDKHFIEAGFTQYGSIKL